MDLSRPILIYSNFCRHSQKFIEILLKNPELYEQMIRMNIDIDIQTRKRPEMFYKLQDYIQMKIDRVPTIITKVKNELLVLGDAEAFKWLDYHMKSKVNDCIAFNPLEMVYFSDQYANYNSTKITDLNDAKEQSYKFLKDKKLTPDNIFKTPGYGNQGVPQEDMLSDTKQNMTHKQNEREQMDAKYQNSPNTNNVSRPMSPNSINNNRMPNVSNMPNNMSNMPNVSNRSNMGIMGPVQRQMTSKTAIDFTNPNFGLAGRLGDRSNDLVGSEKSKVLDQRLQQLLNDRERYN